MAEERLLFLPFEGLSLVITPHHTVGIRLDYSREETGLVPGLTLAIELTPTECRQVAEALLRKAGEAEAGLPRA